MASHAHQVAKLASSYTYVCAAQVDRARCTCEPIPLREDGIRKRFKQCTFIARQITATVTDERSETKQHQKEACPRQPRLRFLFHGEFWSAIINACRERSPNTETGNMQHEASVILLLFHVRGPGLALTPQVNRPEILTVPYRTSCT